MVGGTKNYAILSAGVTNGGRSVFSGILKICPAINMIVFVLLVCQCP